MPSFEIPGGPARIDFMSQSIAGKPLKTAILTYAVTNRTQQRLTARIKVSPVGDAKAGWFEVQGEKERVFAAAETQKITVNVKKPPEAPSADSQGKGAEFNFRLVVMNVNDPGNDFVESAVSTLVEKPPVKPKCTYCPYIAIAAVLLLIIGGATAYFLLRPAPEFEVPDVVTAGNFTCDTAKAYLMGGTPPLTSTCTAAAEATRKPPGIVITQMPEAHTKLNEAEEIKLTFDPGVSIPSNIVGTLLRGIGDRLKDFEVQIVQLGDNGTEDQIASLVPASGTVAKGTHLTVNVHSPGCVRPFGGRAGVRVRPCFDGRLTEYMLIAPLTVQPPPD